MRVSKYLRKYTTPNPEMQTVFRFFLIHLLSRTPRPKRGKRAFQPQNRRDPFRNRSVIPARRHKKHPLPQTMKRGVSSSKLEPALGFEPRTDGLQNRSSTAELSRPHCVCCYSVRLRPDTLRVLLQCPAALGHTACADTVSGCARTHTACAVTVSGFRPDTLRVLKQRPRSKDAVHT